LSRNSVTLTQWYPSGSQILPVHNIKEMIV